MIELRLLGPQSVRRSDGREFGNLPAQPKRFALLAFLAIGNGSLQRRDVIAAMFWPELDQFAARRALRNTLYLLREALGDGVIATQGDELVGVDAGMITADVALLREAEAAGRLQDAIDLYRGELLAGIHFTNAGEVFEQWLASERASLLATAVSAMRTLGDREVASGNSVGAAHWASRASALAPDDESLLRNAMTLLDASSDRGGALRKHEAYAKRLAVEFGAKPSAETEALAKRIRSGTQESDSPRANAASSEQQPTLPAETDAVQLNVPVAISTAAPTSVPHQDELPTPVSTRRSARFFTWSRTSYAVAAILIVVIAGITWARSQRQVPTVVTRPRVLVAVFDNLTGDSTMQPIGRMTQDWLIQGIMRTKLVDVVDERAAMVQGRGGSVDPVTIGKRSGATMIVSGTYYRSGDSLLFQAAVVNAGTGRVMRVLGPIVTTTQQPLVAINELRSRVMTALASSVDLRLAEDINNGGPVPSFDAYQLYIEGWDAFWHGDGRRAETLFVKAAQLDPTFVSAAVSAAAAASNYHECAFVDSLQHALDVPSRNLMRVDRLSLAIAVARCQGQSEEMLRLTLERADLEPRTSSIQISAAAAALWANRPERALTILQRLNPKTDLGWSVDSTHFAYWSGLTEAYHLLGRHEEELSAASHEPAFAPLNRSWMRGRALAALERPVETLALVDTILDLPAETTNDIGLGPYTDGRPPYTATAGWVTVWIARELMTHGDHATARKVAARSYAWYKARSSIERDTPEERLVAAWALDLMGSYGEAAEMARALIVGDTTNVDFRGELASALFGLGDTTGAASVDRWIAQRTDARAGWSTPYYRARDAALIQRPAEAVALVRDAFNDGAWPMWIHLDPALATLDSRPDMRQLIAPRD